MPQKTLMLLPEAEWILGMQKQQISIPICNMYSAIIIYEAQQYALFRQYLVFTASRKILSDRIPKASRD